MKLIKILGKTKKQPIDWSKPMWVKSKIDGDIVIVLTTGEHNGEVFTGTALPFSGAPDGWYSESWAKKFYTPLTEPLTIEISN